MQNERKNIVIYARYSSDKQTEQSIEGQLRVCREYAERNNFNIINEYIDRAITGRTDKRPAFLRMIDDAEKGYFDFILCYKLDRFSRNHYDSVIYKYKLKQFGVRVISATEAISDTAEGFLMEGLLEMMAEMYSKDLSQKVKRGMNENLLKGNFIGGIPPLGYRVENKKLVVDEQQAKIVRYIFEEFANGTSKKDIVEYLNSKGYRSSTGAKFALNTLNLLKNEHYTGYYVLNGVEYENYYPAIIDKQLFDKVQNRLKKLTHGVGPHNRAKEEYLLYGKVFCGHCGTQMIGVSGTSSTGAKYCYYACAKRYKFKSCDKKNEQKAFLEDYVIQETLNTIYDEKQIEKIADNLLEYGKNDLNTLKIKDYQKRLSKIEKEFDKITTAIINASSVEVIKRLDKKANELSIEKEDLQKELTKLQLANKVVRTKAEIIGYIKMFVVGDTSDINYRKRIINSFVNSIYVFDDKIIIYYNVDNLHEIVTYAQLKKDLQNNVFSLLKQSSNREQHGSPSIVLYEQITICSKSYFGIIKTRQK